MDADTEPVRFDTKIAVLLRDDLEAWQALNVAAFLVSAMGQRNPEVIGEPYADADGTEYLPMFRQPVGNPGAVVRARRQRSVSRADLELVGIGVFGPRGAVDKIAKGARMHP
jgi:hypothetical protein